MFTLYGRAAGAFQDPNVFGPFLVLPGIFMLHRLMTGSIARMPLYAVPLLIVTAGIFFSFSRGAWGLFAASAILLIGGLFLQSASGLFRLRVVVMSIVAVGLLLVAIVIVLQIPSVAELFSNRAQLAQDYDSARLGRFARYGIGFQMAMEHPLGIGPLVFGQIFGEDTHDIWLKALMDYGWLGFASWAIMIGWTIAAGFKLLFRDRPWQPYLLCAYVVFVGHVFLGTIIDIDHWRHFYLLLGMVWGGIALEYRYQRNLRPGNAAAGARRSHKSAAADRLRSARRAGVRQQKRPATDRVAGGRWMYRYQEANSSAGRLRIHAACDRWLPTLQRRPSSALLDPRSRCDERAYSPVERHAT